jgi:hypothetical protein
MTKRINKAAKVRMLLRRNPNTKAGAVVELLDCSTQQAHVLLNIQRKAMEIYRQPDGTFKAATKSSSSDETLDKTSSLIYAITVGKDSQRESPRIVETHFPIEMEEPKADPVNHPEHYKTGGIETIDFIEAKNLGYNLGNVVKYITRADHKGNKLQDLQKAQWYLNREIDKAQA